MSYKSFNDLPQNHGTDIPLSGTASRGWWLRGWWLRGWWLRRSWLRGRWLQGATGDAVIARAAIAWVAIARALIARVHVQRFENVSVIKDDRHFNNWMETTIVVFRVLHRCVFGNWNFLTPLPDAFNFNAEKYFLNCPRISFGECYDFHLELVGRCQWI